MTSPLEQKLTQFRNTFSSDFKAKLSVLVKLWGRARTAPNAEILKEFRFEVHSLRGSSGTLGFITLSQLLGDIESKIHTLSEVASGQEKNTQSADVINSIDNCMNKIIKATEQTPNPLLLVSQDSEIFKDTKLISVPKQDDDEIRSQSYRDISIALVDADQASSSKTSQLLIDFGFEVSTYTSLTELQQEKPASLKLLLIDLDTVTGDHSETFRVIESVSKNKIDVFILSSKNSFETRLHAIRAGAKDFLLKPLNITKLVSKIRKNFKIDLTRPYRILLLDDQASVGKFYKTLLETEGVQVLVINEAHKILKALDSFHPDVFLLDMHMPDISGIEVAKLLRQQTKYDYVPIVFLSADNDVETKLAVLECGADDIISKDTPPSIIAQQIDSRIQRGQEIRYIASRDSLTGVLNHGQIMDAAAHDIRLSKRQEKPTIIAMIDLDNFKTVNDQYGHLGGDKVLIALGQLLLQSVRDTDYVGRYGGEEFMIVFNSANLAVIETKMNAILEAFHHITYEVDDKSFNCSFSAGIASSDNHDKLSEIISAADLALYDAKKAGKNQVCISQSK
jgi:diguanylate cyclase (GGDEF)-like protein